MLPKTTRRGPAIAYPTKIATCCFCGTRAALVLNGDRHELSCSGCGAPLHNLKMLPRDTSGDRELVRPSKQRKKAPKPLKQIKKKTKRKKSRWGDLFEDAFDIIEDIFD